MRLIFMGNPQFAVPSLEKLLSSDHEVAAVVTSPDRPKGRGKKLSSPAVAQCAKKHGLNLIQQGNLKDESFLEKISTLAVTLFVVVAFRILPVELFSIPPKGAINLHASLLPKYRGAAPIQWALINGESHTWLTTFQIKKRVDTGGILLKEKVPIKDGETTDELSDRMSLIGAGLLIKTIDGLESGELEAQPQDDTGITKAPKINPEDGLIDWSKPSREIVNLVRGLSSKPGAFTYYQGRKLKIYRAHQLEHTGSEESAGRVLSVDPKCGLIVKSGDGAVQIDDIQMEGKRRMACCDYVRGCPIEKGQALG